MVLFLEKSSVYGSNNVEILEDNHQKMEVLNSGGPSSNPHPTLILSPSSSVPPEGSSSISSIFEPTSPITVMEAMMFSTESSGEYLTYSNASSSEYFPDFNLCGVLSLTLLILPGISRIYSPHPSLILPGISRIYSHHPS